MYSNKKTSSHLRTFKKPSFSNRGNFQRGGNRNRSHSRRGDNIHPSRFINKAVITEKVEHFVPEHNYRFLLPVRIYAAIPIILLFNCLIQQEVLQIR